MLGLDLLKVSAEFVEFSLELTVLSRVEQVLLTRREDPYLVPEAHLFSASALLRGRLFFILFKAFVLQTAGEELYLWLSLSVVCNLNLGWGLILLRR